MRTILFFLLAVPIFLSAQRSLQSDLNMFRANDVLIKKQVEYKDPGQTGENVLWNFSELQVMNEKYEVSYTTQNDTIITGTEHLTRYRYSLQNDSLLLWGFDNQTTRLRNIQPELLLRFPANYGDRTEAPYYAHGKYGNRLEMDAMGTISTVIDSYGTMILPDKDTLKNVLRTHTIKYIAEDTRPIGDAYFDKLESPLEITPDSIALRLNTDTVLFVVETFRWYEKGCRYPVFETVRGWEQFRTKEPNEFLRTAFFFPPHVNYYTEEEEEELYQLAVEDDNMPEDIWKDLSYNIFPNPVESTLNIELYLPKATNVRLRLSSTIGIILIDDDKGRYPSGAYNLQMDVTNLPTNNYILDVWLDGKLINGLIIIKL